LQVANVTQVPTSSIDIRHTTETNDFDEEFAKLDAATFSGQPCLSPFMDKDKYRQDDGGDNVATGQSVGLSSGKGIAPPVIQAKQAMPFLYPVRLCQYALPSNLADLTSIQFSWRTQQRDGLERVCRFLPRRSILPTEERDHLHKIRSILSLHQHIQQLWMPSPATASLMVRPSLEHRLRPSLMCLNRTAYG
jgi:hypothetical protein